MSDLIPLLLAATALSAAAIHVYFRAPGRYWLKVALVPLALTVWVALAAVSTALLGYAYPAQLPTKFTLLGYNVLVQYGHKTGLEVWTDGPRTRLYVIPYTKPMEQALDAAGKKGKGGGRVVMEKTGARQGKGAGAVEENQDDYRSNLILPSDDNPKEPK